jgi:O-antigen/teichoic acid export membrane protein
MKREFLFNLLILISINLLIKPIFILGIDRNVQNIVGAEQYGLYFALLNCSYLMLIFNDFGIQNFNNRNIAQHNHLLSKYFPNIIVLKTILGLVYVFSTMILSFILGYWALVWDIVLLLALNQVLISFVQYCRTNISGLGYYRTDSILSALDRFFMILICGFLFYFQLLTPSNGIRYFIYAQTLAYLLTFIIAFALVFRHLTHFKLRFHYPFLVLIAKKSLPFAFISILMIAYTRLDAVMLERLLPDGKTEAGIYASAYRLLEACGSFSLLFGGLLFPMFSRMLSKGESITGLLNISTRLMAVLGFTAAVCFSVFRLPIMLELYQDATPYWADTLGILIWSFVPISFMYIFGALLMANGNIWALNRIFAVGVFINLIANVVFIKLWKAQGAAASAVLTQSYIIAALMWTSVRVFDFRIDWKMVFRVIIFIGLLLAIAITLAQSNLFWLWSFLATGIAALILSLSLKLIDKDILFLKNE